MMVDLVFTSVLSFIAFIVYIVLILSIMLFISSYLAAVIMILIPVILLFAVPTMSVEFLAHTQAEFVNGTVTINNLHILLFIWSTLMGIIIYTELLSWYILRETIKTEPDKQKPGQVNIPIKPLERLLQKFEKMIERKK
jgi:hypothetical protein